MKIIFIFFNYVIGKNDMKLDEKIMEDLISKYKNKKYFC